MNMQGSFFRLRVIPVTFFRVVTITKNHKKMKNIKLELDDAIAERLEIASRILGVSEGDLIGQSLGNEKDVPISGHNVADIFNNLHKPLEDYRQFIEEVKLEEGINHKPEPAAKRNEFTFTLNEAETLMLELCSIYDNQTSNEYVETLVKDAVTEQLGTIMQDEYFKPWMKELNGGAQS